MREPYPNELYHYGVKGMKWGKRKKYIPHPDDSGRPHGLVNRPETDKGDAFASAAKSEGKFASELFKDVTDNMEIVQGIKARYNNPTQIMARALADPDGFEDDLDKLEDAINEIEKVSSVFEDAHKRIKEPDNPISAAYLKSKPGKSSANDIVIRRGERIKSALQDAKRTYQTLKSAKEKAEGKLDTIGSAYNKLLDNANRIGKVDPKVAYKNRVRQNNKVRRQNKKRAKITQQAVDESYRRW